MPDRNKNAISLLKKDHRTVEGLFKEYKTARSRKQELAARICKELTIHALIEEEIFYPACREGGVDSDMMDEANVEHDGAKLLISELENGSPDEAFYDAKVKVLSEEVRHHIREEEKPGGIFAKAQKAELDLGALGEKLAMRKKELLAHFDESGLPPPMTVTMRAPALEHQATGA